jgi:sulfonate dioxygenase
MAPSATETITVVAPQQATLKLYADGSGDYKELAPSSFEKDVEEGKTGQKGAKVGSPQHRNKWLATV